MESIKNKYLWLGVPFFISLGVLYLWGYWSAFGINIFEYANISDLVLSAIIPLGAGITISMVGFILSSLSPYYNESKKNEGRFAEGFLKKYLHFLASVYLLIILLVAYLIGIDNYMIWIVIPNMLAVFPMLALFRSDFFKEIKLDRLRLLFIFTICLLPPQALSKGRLNAQKILSGDEYKYVELVGEIKMAKYIGHAKDFSFFISQDNKSLVLQKDGDNPLVLNIKNTALLPTFISPIALGNMSLTDYYATCSNPFGMPVGWSFYRMAVPQMKNNENLKSNLD